MNPHHRDKQEARRRREESGQPYAAALNEARLDRAEHRARLEAAAVEPAQPDHDDVPTPKILSNLLRYQTARIARYLYAALDDSRFYEDDFSEWQRLVLYKLTDGLEHHLLLVGTIAGFLQGEGVPPALLRRYLQVRDDQSVEALLTPKAIEQLAGLKGEASPKASRSGVWYEVGQGIAAQQSWCDPEREDALEAFLTALFTSYPEDEQALDHLPERIHDRVLALLPHRNALPDRT